MLEEVTKVNGIDIKYKFKIRSYDTKHLIVVFSGFGSSLEFTYDFESALQSCNANVLWLKDDFKGHCSYYLCTSLDFQVEFAVVKFIDDFRQKLSLSKKECTLAGFSKGGSAALYYGLKYDYSNIVSTVPQTKIGTYVSNSWPKAAINMMGEGYGANEVDKLDSLIPNLLRSDVRLDKNIYILTSRADVQYLTDIEPCMGELLKYSNLNFFLSKSLLVRAHNQVTGHHAQLLLSIFFSLASNAPPKYGYIELEGDDLILKGNEPELHLPYVEVKYLNISAGVLFIEGVGIIRTVSCEKWSDIDYTLVLKSTDNGEVKIPIAKDHKPNLTRVLYKDGFVNYDKCWFCTYKYKGVELASIPPGEYDLFLCIEAKGVMRQVKLINSKSLEINDVDGLSSLIADLQGIKLTICK